MTCLVQNGATGYTLGLWDDGTNAYGVLVATNAFGLQNTNSFDPFGDIAGRFGTTRDAFGITAVSSGVTLTGHVDPAIDGVFNITSGSVKSGVVSAPITVTIYLMNGASQVLQIDQAFSFPYAGNPNIVRDSITLTNLTAGTLSSIKCRKITTYTHYDSNTSLPNTVATIPTPGFSIGGGLTCSDTNGYSFGPFPTDQPADPLVPFHTAGGTPLTTPGTYAASWDMLVPDIAASGTKSFNVYFAINKVGQILTDVITDLTSLGLTNQFTGTNASTSQNAARTATVSSSGLVGAVAFTQQDGTQIPRRTLLGVAL